MDLTMLFLSVLVVGLVFLVVVAWTKSEERISRWLKGSRINYHWKNGAVETSTHEPDNRSWPYVWSWCYPTIEFVRKPFRRLSVSLHGSRWYPPEWRIGRPAGRKHVSDTVSLTSNVLAKTAIQIFGSYPSLQAMLDRITELERELESANKRRQEWGAGIKAILQIVQLDRPRYRSKAAWHIRQCLESIEGSAVFLKEPEPTEEMISRWRSIFGS